MTSSEGSELHRMPEEHSREAAAAASPASRLHPPAARIKNRVTTSLALLALSIACARLIWMSPSLQEWRLQRMGAAALRRECAAHPDDPLRLYFLGVRLNRRGRFGEAEQVLQHAVGIDPDSARTRDEWARAQLGVGRITEAFGQLRQFAGTHPDLASAHRLLGQFYFTQKSMQRASEEFEKAVTLAPSDGASWAYLSQADDQLGIAGRPLVAARQAVRIEPQNAGYDLLLAGLLERARQTEEAGQEYARAVTLAPPAAEIRYRYALWLSMHEPASSGRRQAEAQARRAWTLNPDSGSTALLLGRLLCEMQRPAEAMPLLAQACRLLPDDPAPARRLAQVDRQLGLHSDADRWQSLFLQRQAYASERGRLFQQLRVSPQDRRLHSRMAQLLGRHGDSDGCVRNYATALHRPADAPQTLCAASRDLLTGGHVASALGLAQRAIASSGNNPEAREVLGDALLQTGRLDEAIGAYNYVTNYAPDRVHELQARVNHYAATHHIRLSPAEQAYDEAKRLMNSQIGLRRIPLRAEVLARRSVALDPGNADHLRLLQRIEFEAKQPRDAIETGRQLLQLVPQDTQAHALMAVLLADQSRTPAEVSEAQMHLAAAEGVPETAPQCHYARGLLALRRKDGRLALRELEEAAKQDPGADITYYKISQAQYLLGENKAATQTLALYRQRLQLRQQEFNLQSDISRNSKQTSPYLALASFYRRLGRRSEADAILAAARHLAVSPATQ